MALPAFRYDFLGTMFASLGTGVILPALASQFASKAMSTSIWVVAFLFAQQSLGNVMATFFAQDLAKRRRIPMIVMARVGMAMFVLCIAFLPTEQPGIAGSFAVLLVTPYLLSALCTNLQSTVRHSNYPSNVRGQIFSRLTVVQMGSIAISTMTAGLALDYLSWGHTISYTLSAACLLLSAVFYSRIRIRREKTMLRNGQAQPVRLLAGFRLLREDPVFGRYLCWQMLFGGANMMTNPALTEVMKRYMIHYQEHGFGYGWSMLGRVATPLFVVVCVAPLAGKLFDRISITRFRGLGASLWGLSKFLVFFAVISLSSTTPPGTFLFWVPWVAVFVGFAAQGIGQAAGNIAYNLGHMNFTSPERSHDYMGIHLTFQGIRGLAAPMIGAWLFQLIGMSLLPVAGALIFVAVAGFLLMKPPGNAQSQAVRVASQDAFDNTAGRL